MLFDIHMGVKDGLSIYVLAAIFETFHWNEMKKLNLHAGSHLLKFRRFTFFFIFGASLFTRDFSLSYMRGSRKFCQRGSYSDKFFFYVERMKIPLTTGHHRPASEMPLKWRFAGGPLVANNICWLSSGVIFQGILLPGNTIFL